MAGCARNEIVREGEIGVYHTWSRCVQRACLCGEDPLTGVNYDSWLMARWKEPIARLANQGADRRGHFCIRRRTTAATVCGDTPHAVAARRIC